MPAPTITTAPAAPLRTEDPATFVTKAEAFVDWMAGAPDEFNALAAYLSALESGTLSAKLAAIDALTWAANKLIYLTGSNAVGSTDLTAFARTLLAAADAAAARSALGVDTSTLQPLDSDLTAIAALTTTSFGRSVLTQADAAALRSLAGLVIGTDVPARNPSIQSVTSSATVTPTFANDQVNITAQAAGLTLANPTGTAVDGWGVAIRIKDNGTARSISFGTQYRAIGVTLPTTTIVSKTLYLGMVYNSADTKWDVVAVAQEA